MAILVDDVPEGAMIMRHFLLAVLDLQAAPAMRLHHPVLLLVLLALDGVHWPQRCLLASVLPVWPLHRRSVLRLH